MARDPLQVELDELRSTGAPGANRRSEFDSAPEGVDAHGGILSAPKSGSDPCQKRSPAFVPIRGVDPRGLTPISAASVQRASERAAAQHVLGARPLEHE